jgi:mono/diheme cytochrome c family protein
MFCVCLGPGRDSGREVYMSNVLRSPLLVAGCVAVACSVLTAATAQTPSAQKPKIKTASAVPIQSVDGADNFHAYCAVCHGADAKGNGPAAPAMKVKVPDLTTFAARHDGKFNDVQVEKIITGVGKTPSPAHGVEDMPIWGDVFRSEDKTKTALRVRNIVKYIQSIQAK